MHALVRVKGRRRQPRNANPIDLAGQLLLHLHQRNKAQQAGDDERFPQLKLSIVLDQGGHMAGWECRLAMTQRQMATDTW
jgi:hypothetical protein